MHCFPWWDELANSQDELDMDVWSRSWEPLQHRGGRHQLLLRLYSVLHSTELLLALCPGSLVLKLPPMFLSLKQFASASSGDEWPAVVPYQSLLYLWLRPRKIVLLIVLKVSDITTRDINHPVFRGREGNITTTRVAR